MTGSRNIQLILIATFLTLASSVMHVARASQGGGCDTLPPTTTTTTTFTTTSTSTTTTTAPSDTTPPSQPTGLTAPAASCSQINLAWIVSTDTGGSGLKGYNVYRNSVFVKQVPAPATSTSDTGLLGSTVYAYGVSALDNAGNESTSRAAASTNTPACSSGSWAKRLGGTSGDFGYHVAADGNGNVLVTGFFQGTVYFGTGTVPLTSAGGTDIFVAKYSPTGTALWAKRLGSTGSDVGRGVAVDSLGDVVVTGSFQGAVDFGGGTLTSAGAQDIFVAKYSGMTGTHLWSRRVGGTSDDQGYAVAVDASRNVLVTGFFKLTADFGGGPISSVWGSADVFVAKYSDTGAFVWARTFDNTGSDFGYGIGTDASNNVFITGYFTNDINFGGGLLTSADGYADVFLAKLSATDGSHLWSKRLGSSTTDIGYGLAVDSRGDVVVTGAFQGAVDFGGVTLTSAVGSDAFVAKYSGSTGAYLWAKNFPNTGSDTGYGIAVDGSGNVLMTGSFQGTVDFGGGTLTSAGISDISVVKFSPAGTYLWSKRFGGTNDEAGQSIAVDGSGNVVVTGYFWDTVDFGGGPLTSAGANDIFLLRLPP